MSDSINDDQWRKVQVAKDAFVLALAELEDSLMLAAITTLATFILATTSGGDQAEYTRRAKFMTKLIHDDRVRACANAVVAIQLLNGQPQGSA